MRCVRGRAHSGNGLLDFGQIEGGHLLYSVGEREDRGSYSHREVRKDRAVRKGVGEVRFRLCARIRMGIGWEPECIKGLRTSGLRQASQGAPSSGYTVTQT